MFRGQTKQPGVPKPLGLVGPTPQDADKLGGSRVQFSSKKKRLCQEQSKRIHQGREAAARALSHTHLAMVSTQSRTFSRSLLKVWISMMEAATGSTEKYWGRGGEAAQTPAQLNLPPFAGLEVVEQEKWNCPGGDLQGGGGGLEVTAGGDPRHKRGLKEALTAWMASRRCFSFWSFLTTAPVKGQMK